MRRWRLNQAQWLKTTKPIKAPSIIPLEDDEAIALWDWAQLHNNLREYLTHIPNEAKRSWANGKHQKKKGVRKGTPDYFLGVPRGAFHGYWAELKRRDDTLAFLPWGEIKELPLSKSHLTLEQHTFLINHEYMGYKVDVWYGAQDAQDKILAYLALS